MENQLTLGELIKQFEDIKEHAECNQEVFFDFGYYRPTSLYSWRGAYEELGLSYDEESEATVESLLIELKSAIGKQFTGYKGGDYIMSEDTPVWAAQPNHGGYTAICGVTNIGYRVIINTILKEY